MKYVYKIIPGVILFMGLAGACKDDDSTSIPGGIAVDKEEITIGPEGGTEQIAVTSYSNWVAGASKPWIFVSPANGSSSAECQLAIDSTLENTARTSQIRFALEGQEAKRYPIRLRQANHSQRTGCENRKFGSLRQAPFRGSHIEQCQLPDRQGEH